MDYNYDTSTLLTIKENIITEEDRYLVGTLYLAPQKNLNNAKYYGVAYDESAINLSKVNLCKKATNGCATSCIYHQGIFKTSDFEKNKIKQARFKRTFKFLLQREAFFAQLCKEIAAMIRRAKRKGLHPSIQLNGTSDILWEKEAFSYKEEEYKNMMELFPEVTFFDYTKYDIKKSRKKLPSNYHLTYSRAGKQKGILVDNWEYLNGLLKDNIDVAIIFSKKMKSKILEESFHNGIKVIDGDIYNYRAYDLYQRENTGLIVAIEAARKTELTRSGFIIQEESCMQEFLN
ncbi:MAG: hypothetical protein COA66_04670 [Arcobacter sp.]|nr:hypothetical protein [Campylobacteraceae bacterium]PHR73094.1 MAG: hypothetical protein COA66_04670 [Arcobacter sp.]